MSGTQSDRALAASVEDQSEVIEFLSDPSSYTPPVADVRCIETHGALVFLAGDRAYKLKRAVKLPYLDFSTIVWRAKACHHEIERNRPAAPNIYIAVQPIVRHPSGNLAIAGDEGTVGTDGTADTVIDWVVVMNRFDQMDLLDNRARHQDIPIDLMIPLAEEIAAYHAYARTYCALDGSNTFSNIVTQTIMTLFEAGEPLKLCDVHAYAGRIVTELNVQSNLLRSRGRHGHIRLCHGDLHLRNIVLRDGQPTLFDAIEFDDALAKIDVLYDLAFLLMDLWHRGLERHANLCFNTYVSKAIATDALNGLAALPLFLGTRAAIRAIVALDRAAIAGDDKLAETRDEIASYFALARKFLEGGEPVLIAIGGYSGTGKSTLAAALAPSVGRAPGALHLRSDVERKRMVGTEPLERLPRHAYLQSTTAKVYKHLCHRAEQALRAGHSVIVDATFLEAAHRRQIEQVAVRTHVAFTGIWLDADPNRLVERVSQRRNDASDADASIVMAQVSSRAACTRWETIDTGGELESVLSRAKVTLRARTRYRQ